MNNENFIKCHYLMKSTTPISIVEEICFKMNYLTKEFDYISE